MYVADHTEGDDVNDLKKYYVQADIQDKQDIS